MNSSRRIKEAIKTALAMTLTYAIALSLGWEQITWAAFTVAFVSLQTIGQSINKAALRLFGTLLAAVLALTLIALFAQQRWLFMVFLSAWIGVCTYMMGGKSNQYFWNVSAFTCVIICMTGGPDPVNGFDTAILRTQETALGILVYSLVSLFLWPNNAQSDFEAATLNLASIQHKLFQTYIKLISNKEEQAGSVQQTEQEAQKFRASELQALNQFQQMLNAATTDSYVISENQLQWQLYSDTVYEINNTLESWQQSFSDIQTLDVSAVVSKLEAFNGELDNRAQQIQSMLMNKQPATQPQAIELSFNQAAIAQLSHFNKAAVTVFILQANKLERLSRNLFTISCNIKGFSEESLEPENNLQPIGSVEKKRSSYTFIPDIDRLLAVIRVVISMWLAYLVIIYVGDIPGGMGLISILVSLAMVSSLSPQLPIAKMVIPLIANIIFSSILYIFVMPQLSTFLGLGILIFCVTFIVCYLFYAPQQMFGRSMGLALFIVIASISIEQTYSFFVISTTSLMFALVLSLLAITAYIPFSPQAEKTYLRLLSRFFRYSHALVSIVNHDPKEPLTALQSWKKQFYLRELISLPAKLSLWGRLVDKELLPDNPQALSSLAINLQLFIIRLQELLEIQKQIHSEKAIQDLLLELKNWHYTLQDTLYRLSTEPTISDSELFRKHLNDIMINLEKQIKEAINQTNNKPVSQDDREHFYHLLGAFRGLSEALIGYSGSTDKIQWSRWQEQRF